MQKNMRCGKCGKSRENIQRFTRHKNIEHAVITVLLESDYCEKKISPRKKQSLAIHLEERPFSCDKCDKKNSRVLQSGGKETNQDFLGSGERTEKSPAPIITLTVLGP